MQLRKTLFAASFTLALAALAGTVAADTAGQSLTEARQETQIWTTYALSPYLRASHLEVSVRAGTATLSGTVEEDVSRDLARQIALGVNGISEVENLIVVQAGYVPAVPSGERAYGEVIDDASITAAVKSRLMWSKDTDGLAPHVDTNRGKVTLTGSADTSASSDLATRLAMDTRGVTSVDNQLAVAGAKPGSGAAATVAVVAAGAEVSDRWITAKVKSTLLYSGNVDGTDITVTTKGGVVTLIGMVDSGAERALAIELAETVRGVKSVLPRGLAIGNVVASR